MGATKANPNSEMASSNTEPRGSDGFAHLSPHIRHISRSTIRRKWKPLPQSSQDRIRANLLSLKARRAGANDHSRVPTMASLKTKSQDSTKQPQRWPGRTKKQEADEEYQAAVDMVTEKLLGRIPRMPFPPSSTNSNPNGNSNNHTDESFSLEATLHRISTLESTLSMHTSTSHLLRAQMKREKRALRRDRAELDTLQTALRSETRLRKVQERGLHPVTRALNHSIDHGVARGQRGKARQRSASAPGDDAEEESSDDDESSQQLQQQRQPQPHLRPTQRNPPSSGTSLNYDLEPDMKNIMTRLRSHLTSMQTNTDGMQPVLQAMDKTKVALDQFVTMRFTGADRDRACGLHD
ncbi:hypothetical protein PV10_03173 [Exophiala mesophila]|uniref:Uncharacterized protein n=1 Tax=Exophiala mesophila TaxID=212818 RepID=A0A0D1ZLR8_EXOME|nr:uncharacterized protein PV10_03173 [Exophiala mesophila]KIV95532.1 hypothetical protein PV10_03173 [Exophiala mesophila]